jgi:hypothetical protein
MLLSQDRFSNLIKNNSNNQDYFPGLFAVHFVSLAVPLQLRDVKEK